MPFVDPEQTAWMAKSRFSRGVRYFLPVAVICALLYGFIEALVAFGPHFPAAH